MIDFQNDNTRHLGGAIDLSSYREGPSEAESRRARLQGLLRFRERFQFDFGMNMNHALFHECDTDAMRPHFGRRDWLVLDTTRDRIRSEEFYVVEFPEEEPSFQPHPVPRLVRKTAKGFVFFASNDPEGCLERFVPYGQLSSLVVLGAVRAVFKNPNR